MPRVLLGEVYAGEVKGRTETGRQRARDTGAWEGGQERTRENEHTRGRAGPGSGSRGGEQGGRVASRIAPHRARAGRRAASVSGPGARTTRVPRNRAARLRRAGALDVPRPLGSVPPEVSCAVQGACHKPGAQDTRGQQGREGVGGLPCALLCTVHAEGIEGGGGQRDRRPETQQPGTRGRAR